VALLIVVLLDEEALSIKRGGWEMLGAELTKHKEHQNLAAYSLKYEQAKLYHHASDSQHVKCSKIL